MDLQKIIYSLNVQDMQTVALDVIGRELLSEELNVIEDKLGDYIDWYQAIELAIKDVYQSKQST